VGLTRGTLKAPHEKLSFVMFSGEEKHVVSKVAWLFTHIGFFWIWL
jgi:hypothetical protein